MRIAFAGKGVIAEAVFKSLVASQHEVIALITSGKRKKASGSSFKATISSFLRGEPYEKRIERFAGRIGIPVFDLSMIYSEDRNKFLPTPDILLVCDFPILRESALQWPNVTCINIHPSLLPKYRGIDPVARAVLNCEETIGLTYHLMTSKVDRGSILRQYPIPLENGMSKSFHVENLANLAARTVCDCLNCGQRNGFRGTPQNEMEASYFSAIRLEDLFIDWSKSVASILAMTSTFDSLVFPRFHFRNKVIRVVKLSGTTVPHDFQPGLVIRTGFRPAIAVRDGIVSVALAFQRHPFPFLWPNFLSNPSIMENLISSEHSSIHTQGECSQ